MCRYLCLRCRSLPALQQAQLVRSDASVPDLRSRLAQSRRGGLGTDAGPGRWPSRRFPRECFTCTWTQASGPAIRSMFSVSGWRKSTRRIHECHRSSVDKRKLSAVSGVVLGTSQRFCSLQILDDGDLPPVGVIWTQAVHVEAAVPGQAAHHRTEGKSHTGGSFSVLVHVSRQRPLARGHFLADRRGDAQLGGQLALDGGGALEPVIDVNAESSPGLLELRRHVCRPLGSVSSELTDLPTENIGIYSQLLMN